MQVIFEDGVRAMFSGNYDSSIKTFEQLYQATKSQRVKLEWARSAFLAKQYKLSKRLFDEVMAENPPAIVKFNIHLFLGEISKLGDQTDYGFSVVRDTNPFGFSKPQNILIYGIPFSYTPPTKKETLTGLNFYINHSMTLNEGRNIRLIANLEDTEYQGENNNKSSAKLALQFKINAEDNLDFKIGGDYYFQRRELLMIQPYLGLQYRKDQVGGVLDQYQFSLRAARNQFPDFPHIDGPQHSVSASATKSISQHVQLSVDGYLDQFASKTKSQGFNTTTKGVRAKIFAPIIGSFIHLGYTQTSRDYKELDELFLVKRNDDRVLRSITLQPYSFKILSLHPSIEMGYEKLASNISINSFERKYINFALKRNF